jgi:hypothetical protein
MSPPNTGVRSKPKELMTNRGIGQQWEAEAVGSTARPLAR